MSHLTICLIICVLTMASYIWGKLPMGLTAMLSMAVRPIGSLPQM